jgi:Arc/MetJ family transcription regulator
MPTPKRVIRKNIDIDAAKLAAARRILGAPTDTATVDQALDDIIFVHELQSAMDQLTAAGPLGEPGRHAGRARRVAQR